MKIANVRVLHCREQGVRLLSPAQFISGELAQSIVIFHTASVWTTRIEGPFTLQMSLVHKFHASPRLKTAQASA